MQNVEKVTLENNNAPFDTIVGEVIGRNFEEAVTDVQKFLYEDNKVPVLLIKTTDGELRWVEESKATFI